MNRGKTGIFSLFTAFCLTTMIWGGGCSNRANERGTINGHDYVDLGLSVKWATCNVGASTPSDYGDYFAWGETELKLEYTRENSLTFGKKMDGIAGNPEYDAATANWGGSWRLPTEDEMRELCEKCELKLTTQGKGKVQGYTVIGPNGNSIFLPAAGLYSRTSLNNAGEYGYYWSASPYKDNTNRAYHLYLYSDRFGMHWCYRGNGFSVRPVTE